MFSVGQTWLAGDSKTSTLLREPAFGPSFQAARVTCACMVASRRKPGTYGPAPGAADTSCLSARTVKLQLPIDSVASCAAAAMKWPPYACPFLLEPARVARHILGPERVRPNHKPIHTPFPKLCTIPNFEFCLGLRFSTYERRPSPVRQRSRGEAAGGERCFQRAVRERRRKTIICVQVCVYGAGGAPCTCTCVLDALEGQVGLLRFRVSCWLLHSSIGEAWNCSNSTACRDAQHIIVCTRPAAHHTLSSLPVWCNVEHSFAALAWHWERDATEGSNDRVSSVTASQERYLSSPNYH